MTVNTRLLRRSALLVVVTGALLVVSGGALAQEDLEIKDEPCDGPKNIRALAQGDGSILVEWDRWDFARAYQVFRAEGDGEFVQVGVTGGHNPDDGDEVEPEHETSFLDTDTEVGVTYTYRIQAFAPPPHLSDVCGEASVTAIPVFPSLIAGGLASMVGVGAYLASRRR